MVLEFLLGMLIGLEIVAILVVIILICYYIYEHLNGGI